jgi:hypothetical protein
VLSTYLGHINVSDTYWCLTACPELMGQAARRLEQRWEVKAMKDTPSFAVPLQAFFTQRSIKHRRSPATID